MTISDVEVEAEAPESDYFLAKAEAPRKMTFPLLLNLTIAVWILELIILYHF
jgi:hypothetical protein